MTLAPVETEHKGFAHKVADRLFSNPNNLEAALHFHPLTVDMWGNAVDHLLSGKDGPVTYVETSSLKRDYGIESRELYSALIDGAVGAYNFAYKLHDDNPRKSQVLDRIKKALGWAVVWPQYPDLQQIDSTMRDEDSDLQNIGIKHPGVAIAIVQARMERELDQFYLWDLAVEGVKSIVSEEKAKEVGVSLLRDILTYNVLLNSHDTGIQDPPVASQPELLMWLDLFNDRKFSPVERETATRAVGDFVRTLIGCPRDISPHSGRRVSALLAVNEYVSRIDDSDSLDILSQYMDLPENLPRGKAHMTISRILHRNPGILVDHIAKHKGSPDVEGRKIAARLIRFLPEIHGEELLGELFDQLAFDQSLSVRASAFASVAFVERDPNVDKGLAARIRDGILDNLFDHPEVSELYESLQSQVTPEFAFRLVSRGLQDVATENQRKRIWSAFAATVRGWKYETKILDADLTQRVREFLASEVTTGNLKIARPLIDLLTNNNIFS